MTEETAGEPVLTGRFADPDATRPVDLGACRCPGRPHEKDSAVVRSEIGDGEARSALNRGGYADGSGVFDGPAGDDESIARFVLSWTLVDERGRTMPISRRNASLLDDETRGLLIDAIGEAISRRAAPLPNGSGARSRASSRASASRTRTTKTRH